MVGRLPHLDGEHAVRHFAAGDDFPIAFALLMAVGLAVHRLVFRRLTRTSPNLDVFEARA